MTLKTVERGAELLDEKYGPDWDERIDLDTLALQKSCDCVLGQLEGSYDEGMDRLGLAWDAGRRYGFDTGIVKSYDRLTTAWSKLVERRRAARAK